jgi:hypothetical protein
MNEQDVRAIVREAIERHLSRPDRSANRSADLQAANRRASLQAAADRSAGLQAGHPSHVIVNVFPGSDIDDGMCVIEPAVRCTHCGFCQSYGH